MVVSGHSFLVKICETCLLIRLSAHVFRAHKLGEKLSTNGEKMLFGR